MTRRRASKPQSSTTDVASSLDEALARVDGAGDGAATDSVPTGFPSVDGLMGGGLRRGDLVVLGGDVGSGKSALAIAVAIRSSAEGRSVDFYVGETSTNRVVERILSIEGRASVDEMRRGALDDASRAAVAAAAARLREADLALARMPPTVEQLAEHLGSRRRADLAVVDPLQMLAGGRMAQDEELAAAVRRLKTVAVDKDIALLVTAHLPHLAARPDRRPQLDDFGTLGAIKQHADVVLGLFREGMYDTARSLEGATELHVLKNRSGATGYADLFFYQRWMRFEDLVDPDR